MIRHQVSLAQRFWCQGKLTFWLHFSKPHQKLRIIQRDGFYLPRSHYSNAPRARPLIRLTTTARRVHLTKTPDTVLSRLPQITQTRNFRTTLPNRVPPLLWAVLKPVSKVWAMLWGRYIRRWWGRLSSEQKIQYKDLFGGMKGIILGALAMLAAAFTINYLVHLQENPLTGRMRFISLTHDQIMAIASFEEDSYLDQYRTQLLAPDSPDFRRVSECAHRLLRANQQQSEKFTKLRWKISVVDAEEVNAFVLPNGHIFIFTAMLRDLHNEDQLGMILGHEIAHAIMDHSIEHISRGQILDFLMVAALAAIWTFVPGDGIAIITQWFYKKLMDLMIHLPYSRELEMEADRVGLQFAARACYDIREAAAFWGLQCAVAQTQKDRAQVPEFFSTHPTHETRVAQLQALIPECAKLREDCKCPKLPKLDPRVRANEEIDAIMALKQTPKTALITRGK